MAVLAAAAMHAGWNAMLKFELDRLRSMLMLTLAMGLFGLMMLIVFPWPAQASLPFVIASGIIHCGYKLFLIRAYAAGDLSQVYPLARGTAPLLTTAAAFLFAGEVLSPFTALGIALILAGIYVLGLHGAQPPRPHEQAGDPVRTGNLGVHRCLFHRRRPGGPPVRNRFRLHSGRVRRRLFDFFHRDAGVARPGGARGMGRQWHKGAIAGALSLGSYWVALWAMTRAPIGVIASLRETSILFAMALGVVWLKEPLTPWRMAAAVLIVAGAAVLRYG